ncbi:MAG: SurA N-terminal domain-containing protein [Chloroflexota bacterium]
MLRPDPMSRWGWLFVALLLLALLLAGCREDAPSTNEAATAVPAEIPTAMPTAAVPETVTETEPTAVPTATAVPVTPTPDKPLAVLVNDQPIYLDDYEKELARYEQAYLDLGDTPPVDYRDVVLNSLIERALIVQAANAQGITVTAEAVDARLVEMRAGADGEANFAAWLEANQYTEEEFRDALAMEIITAQMLDQVTADVPYAVEQVHARYIQVDDGALATSLREQIVGGSDFALLAQQYSLDQVAAQAGGDLGYFARWSLQVPEVAEAAFALQPDEISDVIAVTNADGSQTFYLVQVIEKEAQRPLTANMRYDLLKQTFEAWLTTQWEQASITRFVEING